VVLQEYIEGGAKTSRVVNAYCDRSSKVRAIGVGEPLIEYSGDKLIGNYAAIRSVDDRRLCDAVADFLYRIGYVGFANIDVKIDTRTDCYYFLELNPRQGRSSYFMRIAGINLMRALYEDAVLGAKYSAVHYAKGDGVWLNEPIGVIKREMKRLGLKPNEELLLGRTALDITYDFSIPRAAMLLKRKIGSYFRPI
jgi:D-aspartate ligase